MVRAVLFLPVSIASVLAAFSQPRANDPYTVVASPAAVALAASVTEAMSAREPEQAYLTKTHAARIEQSALPMHGAAWIYGTPGEPCRAQQAGLHSIGVRTIAFVAHPHREIETISREQIESLFDGTITNWRHLGGPDAPIRLLRTTDADDLESIRRFLGKAISEPRNQSDSFCGDHRCERLVAGDPFAIGTMSLSAAERAIEHGVPLRILSVQGIDVDCFEASSTGPLVRTLNLCIAHPDDARSDRLIAYLGSPAGRSALMASGYDPLALER